MSIQARFTERLSLVEAWAWLDACTCVAKAEPVILQESFGRVLAEPLTFSADRPDRDIALIDGHAVLAQSTQGASTYNPLFLTIVPKGMPLLAGCASVCHAGETMPPGADTVLPLEFSEAAGTVLEVSDAVARGTGVGRKGQGARRGDLAVTLGRRLDAPQIALAASLGLTRLTVRRRPDVAVILAGAKPPRSEALGLAMAALVTRDGGVAHCTQCRDDMAQTLRSLGATDLVLLIGRSGWGEDDHALEAIAAAGGRIDHHGLALTPGGSAGFGWLGSAPLLLLPGDPLSALADYEMLAGRLVRRCAGRKADFPSPIQQFTLSRKIASSVGVSEWVPMVCVGSTAEPLACSPADGLAGYAMADGFLIVPAGLEGYAPGTLVDVAVASGDNRREKAQ